MRKLFSLAAAMGLFLGVGAAQPAHAVVQTLSAASLSITISALPGITLAWNGTGGADVTATSISGLTAGIFNFTGEVPVTDPAAFPIAGLFMKGATNGVGNFTGVDAIGGGAMAIKGVAEICLFAACAGPPANVSVPFTTAGVNGVGLGGTPIAVVGLVNVTVPGNIWTTGVATANSSTGLVSVSGSPLSGGHIKLVSPVTISTNIGASAQLPMFAVMELTFIPEPGTLLLLASGVAGLAIVGRKRMSK